MLKSSERRGKRLNFQYFQFFTTVKMTTEKLYDFCTHCRVDRAYTLRKKIVKKEIRGKTYNFEITVAVCEECGEEMGVPGLLDLNMEAIDEQYRRAEAKQKAPAL